VIYLSGPEYGLKTEIDETTTVTFYTAWLDNHNLITTDVLAVELRM
jgi:hypothetical protein